MFVLKDAAWIFLISKLKVRKQIWIPSDTGYSLKVYRFTSTPFRSILCQFCIFDTSLSLILINIVTAGSWSREVLSQPFCYETSSKIWFLNLVVRCTDTLQFLCKLLLKAFFKYICRLYVVYQQYQTVGVPLLTKSEYHINISCF